ncbi:hypothetical protein D9M71_716510 [compost metagenome]
MVVDESSGDIGVPPVEESLSESFRMSDKLLHGPRNALWGDKDISARQRVGTVRRVHEDLSEFYEAGAFR